MTKDGNTQADPKRLGDAIRTTSSTGKSPEQWAREVWTKAQTQQR